MSNGKFAIAPISPEAAGRAAFGTEKRSDAAMQPDILIFLSNQHDGRIQAHMGDSTVRTPHLDRLAWEGVTFTQAYTPCPLCVPARMSLLTGQLPSHTGVFTNSGSIHPEMPTFLHALELAGYEGCVPARPGALRRAARGWMPAGSGWRQLPNARV